MHLLNLIFIEDMKKKNLATLSLLIVLSIQSMSAQKHDDISLLEKPVPISTVKGITGFFGEHMEVNRQYLNDLINFSPLNE